MHTRQRNHQNFGAGVALMETHLPREPAAMVAVVSAQNRAPLCTAVCAVNSGNTAEAETATPAASPVHIGVASASASRSCTTAHVCHGNSRSHLHSAAHTSARRHAVDWSWIWA